MLPRGREQQDLRGAQCAAVDRDDGEAFRRPSFGEIGDEGVAGLAGDAALEATDDVSPTVSPTRQI
jgi:hypothetical protein